MQSHAHTHTHKHVHVSNKHMHVHTYTCIHLHSYTQTHACTHIYTSTLIHTNTYMYTVLVHTNIYTKVVNKKKHGTWSLSVVICCRWHYSCTDLGSMLQQNLVPMATVYTVLGLGFYSNPDPALRGFYVDEVSFSSVSRSLVDVSHANAASLFNLYLCKGGYILPE